MAKEVSAGIILVKDHKYLILHYEKDYWAFAKGKIEKGETEKDAAIREVQEETGISDVQFIKGFKERESYFYKREGKLINKEVIYFLGKTKTENITISFEHQGYVWLSFEEALQRLKFKKSKELLTKVHEFLEKRHSS